MLKAYHEDINNAILKREEEKLKSKENAKKSNDEYEVEAIIDSKAYKGKTKYLIRWKGWDEADDTWEPEETLSCPELIRAFKKKTKSAKSTPKKSAKKRKRVNDSDSGSESDDSNDSDFGSNSKRSRGEYEVSKILNSRINRDGKWEFYVMWKGYNSDSNTWEPESNLSCIKLINDVS